jgi:hypothetical protein
MEIRDDLSQDVKSLAGKVLILADSLETVAADLDAYIIANLGDRAAWTHNVGITKEPKKYGAFASVWNCREEANSALHWVGEIIQEDAITYYEAHK